MKLSCCESKLKYHNLVSKNYSRYFEFLEYHKLRKCEPQNHLANRGMDNEKILVDLGYTKKDIKKLYLKNILSEGNI